MLHTSIRITNINTRHVRFDVFTANTIFDPPHPDDPPLRRITRGLAGRLVVDTATAEEIILGFPALVQVTVSDSVLNVDLGLLPKIKAFALHDMREGNR